MKNADLMIHDSQGRLILAVEVKDKSGATREWARQYRTNLEEHGSLPGAPYFLLALPDRFYFWKREPGAPFPLEPTDEMDPRPFLEPFYRELGIAPAELTGYSFEMFLTTWFSRMTQGEAVAGPMNPQDQWLKATGLFEALRGGRVELDRAA